jgi:hypothetical protein
MSTLTETLNRKPVKTPAKAPVTGAGVLVSFIATLAAWAFVVWLAGIGLDRGFGVPAPFVPVFILTFAAATAVKILALTVFKAWHDTALETAAGKAAAELAGTVAAAKVLEAEHTKDLMDDLISQSLKGR